MDIDNYLEEYNRRAPEIGFHTFLLTLSLEWTANAAKAKEAADNDPTGEVLLALQHFYSINRFLLEVILPEFEKRFNTSDFLKKVKGIETPPPLPGKES